MLRAGTQDYRNIGDAPLAERVGFEPTRACALSIFETDALVQAMRPLRIYIYYMQLRRFIFRISRCGGIFFNEESWLNRFVCRRLWCGLVPSSGTDAGSVRSPGLTAFAGLLPPCRLCEGLSYISCPLSNSIVLHNNEVPVADRPPAWSVRYKTIRKPHGPGIGSARSRNQQAPLAAEEILRHISSLKKTRKSLPELYLSCLHTIPTAIHFGIHTDLRRKYNLGGNISWES